jgi:hypothetical protein
MVGAVRSRIIFLSSIPQLQPKYTVHLFEFCIKGIVSQDLEDLLMVLLGIYDLLEVVFKFKILKNVWLADTTFML